MKPQLQTHALVANHSCEVRQRGQNERLKKTGMEWNLPRSIYMPVDIGFPVLGQRIMSSPITRLLIDFLGTAESNRPRWPQCKPAVMISRHCRGMSELAVFAK